MTPYTVVKNIPFGAIRPTVLREEKLFTEHGTLPIWDLPTYFIIGLSRFQLSSGKYYTLMLPVCQYFAGSILYYVEKVKEIYCGKDPGAEN